MAESQKIILICNDDSISAPGLKVLARTVAHLGKVVIVAPEQPQSGQSCAFTVTSPLYFTHRPDEEFPDTYTVNGTPVDCIKLALHTLLFRPDIVLSGINHGSNAGVNSIYSGTMGAAFEACIQGITAVGYSLLHHSLAADFSQTLPYVSRLTELLLNNPLPPQVCLNVNFPAKVKIEGIKLARAARSYWTEEYQQYETPGGTPFYMLTGKIVNAEPESTDTDLYWLDRNYATIVPVTPNQNASVSLDTLQELI